MGFFNFEKEGPGVSKNGPKKKGLFLFFELLGRKIGKFCEINMLYFLVSLPMIIISFFAAGFFMRYGLTILQRDIGDPNYFTQVCLFVAFMFVVIIGSGPASASLAYFNRCAVREEATFLFADFKEQFKKNFIQGMIVGVINTVVIFVMIFAMEFYIQLSVLYPAYSDFCSAGIIIMLAACVVFSSAMLYIYQLMVTFENSVLQLYKNSLILALMNMPMNILLMVIVLFLNFPLFTVLSPIASPVLSFVCWVAIVRFVFEFYTARVVDKKIIKNINKEGKK